MNAIGTLFCPADIGTKPQAAPRCKLLCHMIGIAASSDHGVVPVGHDEFWKAWKDDSSKKAYARASKVSVEKLKHFRRLLAFSILELSEASPTSTSLPTVMAETSVLNILMYFSVAILVMLIVVYLYFFFVYFAYKEIKVKGAMSAFVDKWKMIYIIVICNLMQTVYGMDSDGGSTASSSTSSWSSTTTLAAMVGAWTSSMASSSMIILAMVLSVVAFTVRRWASSSASADLENQNGASDEPL